MRRIAQLCVITRAAMLTAFASGLLVAAPIASIQAAEPGYVGTWAADLAQCKVEQDRQEAPLVMRADGYDQHETHCTFKNISAHENEWKVTAECSVEGDKQTHDLGIMVSGDTLTFKDDAGSQDFLKCN